MSQYNQEKAWSDFRVGLITFAGLALLILGVVLAGGDKGLFFQKTTTLKAHLSDVGGLKKGSSITMGGMTVGRVMDIAFVQGSKDNNIEVVMEVRSDVRHRIREDSIPSVRTQGMLGDRYMDIAGGTEGASPLAEGEILLGEAASDFDKTLRQAMEVLQETSKMLTAVNNQEGTAGRLVYDVELYDALTELTQELNGFIKDFKKHPKKYIKLEIF